MLIALWIINAVLAVAFLGAGVTKLARPKSALAGSGMAWVEDFSQPVVKLIATAEVLGAIGLVLPLLLRVAPIVSPIAAGCLVVLMIGAVATHIRRSEIFWPPLVLGLLAAASAVLGFIVVLGE